MITIRIIYTRADGGCSVVMPAPHGRRFLDTGASLPAKMTADEIAAAVSAGIVESDDAFLKRIMSTLPPDAKNVRVVDASDIPSDRTFRGAWRNNAGKLHVDMPAARELWRDKMRRARARKLAALDVEYQRADEAGDAGAKQAVSKRKQVLRDVTDMPEIEAAKTPDELKAVWPEELD